MSLDHKWKNIFYVWELEKYSVEHKECLSNYAEVSTGSKISARTNILRTLRYCFPTSFFRYMKHSPSMRSAKISFLCGILEIKHFHLSTSSQIFPKFTRSSNISVREIIIWNSSYILWFPPTFSGTFNDYLFIQLLSKSLDCMKV